MSPYVGLPVIHLGLSNSPHIALLFLVGVHTLCNFLDRELCYFLTCLRKGLFKLLVLLLPTMDANVLSIALAVAKPCCWEEQDMAAEYCCNYGCRELYHRRHALWCPIFIDIVSREAVWNGSCFICFFGTPAERGMPWMPHWLWMIIFLLVVVILLYHKK